MTRIQIYSVNLICLLFSLITWGQERRGTEFSEDLIDPGVFLVVLGTVQDAGAPHIACKKECCALLFENHDYSRKVVSLGLVDQINFSKYIFEATPDLPTLILKSKK